MKFIKRETPEYISVEEIAKNYGGEMSMFKRVHLFGKSDRSTFRYWFAHWAAYQMTALNLGVWKFRHLFHDIEKPWLRLVKPYPWVQSYHRTHARHHLQYGLYHGFEKVRALDLVVDWECSRFTKLSQPLDARQTLEREVQDPKFRLYEKTIRDLIEPILDSLDL